MTIEQVRAIPELHEVWRLLHQVYVCRGYCEPQPNEMFIEHPELDLTEEGALYTPTTIFYERDETGQMIGTISVTLDGSEGLHTDQTFPHETQIERDYCDALGLNLCATWRIVVKRQSPHYVIGELMQAAIHWAKEHEVSVALATFHPRHEKIYQLQGFKTLAYAANEAGLQNAPSVLMRLDRKGIERWRGKRLPKRHDE